jgi:hypothetical protein
MYVGGLAALIMAVTLIAFEDARAYFTESLPNAFFYVLGAIVSAIFIIVFLCSVYVTLFL